jgi:aryl-alcohol dehydrogenase-like predicted oxidoreductase
MKYRQLGNSGLHISEISFGTWLTVGLGVEKQTAFDCMRKAIELGVNFIDTADMYNKGESEKTVGEFVRTIKREEVIIGTKAFGPMSDHFMTQGLSMRKLRNACEESLQRLKTDYIDLYQCHRYDIDTPLEETCYAMHNLVDRGYILHWGVSQWTAVQITNAVRICEKNGWQRPVSNQPVYNMLNRSLETDVMDVCNNEKLGIVVYSPLAQGLLTGKYDRNNTPADSRLASEVMNAWFPSKRMDENYFDMQDQLKAKAKEWGMNMGQLALNWVLAHKPITSAIIGASRPEQVENNVAALSHTLTTEQVDQIDVILDNAPVDQYTGLRIGYGIIKRGY